MLQSEFGYFIAPVLIEKALQLQSESRQSWFKQICQGQNPPHVTQRKVRIDYWKLETCRRLKIHLRDYLGSVLPGLGDFPINRVAELTPCAWATRN
jgi:hypothetical protein